MGNYWNMADKIHASEDLKEKTRRRLAQALLKTEEHPAALPKTREKPPRKRLALKSAICLSAAAMVVLAATLIPTVFLPLFGNRPSNSPGFTVTAFAAEANPSEKEIQLMNMKRQINGFRFVDEDVNKPDRGSHRITTMVETAFTVVGDNIDKVTFSVSDGAFQKRIMIPGITGEESTDELVNYIDRYSKENGLDVPFSTSVGMGNEDGSEMHYFNFGYNKEQVKSYTIDYDKQDDFASQYGYRLTIIGNTGTGYREQYMEDRSKQLDQTRLTITAHFKDGTSATKIMKLMEESMTISAVELDTPPLDYYEPPTLYQEKERLQQSTLKLSTGNAILERRFHTGYFNIVYDPQPFSKEPNVIKAYVDFELKIKKDDIQQLTVETQKENMGFAAISVIEPDSEYYQWIEAGQKDFLESAETLDPITPESHFPSRVAYYLLEPGYPLELNQKYLYIPKLSEHEKSTPSSYDIAEDMRTVAYRYRDVGKSYTIQSSDLDDFGKQYSLTLEGIAEKRTHIGSLNKKETNYYIGDSQQLLQQADGNTFTVTITYKDGTTETVPFTVHYVPRSTDTGKLEFIPSQK